MRVQFTRETLVTSHVFAAGDFAEVLDQVGHRLLASGAAAVAVAVETDQAPAPDQSPAVESAALDAAGRRKKV
jgi:hypothetical protein